VHAASLSLNDYTVYQPPPIRAGTHIQSCTLKYRRTTRQLGYRYSAHCCLRARCTNQPSQSWSPADELCFFATNARWQRSHSHYGDHHNRSAAITQAMHRVSCVDLQVMAVCMITPHTPPLLSGQELTHICWCTQHATTGLWHRHRVNVPVDWWWPRAVWLGDQPYACERCRCRCTPAPHQAANLPLL
jgi:hypothetical protein